jgi:hypothetical protein
MSGDLLRFWEIEREVVRPGVGLETHVVTDPIEPNAVLCPSLVDVFNGGVQRVLVELGDRRRMAACGGFGSALMPSSYPLSFFLCKGSATVIRSVVEE